MIFNHIYQTPPPFDNLLLLSDGKVLTGLHFLKTPNVNFKQTELPVFQEVCHWLDIYFSGREPEFTPQFRIDNATPFRRDVLEILQQIPFGKTMTYGDIAAEMAKKHGIERMSAQAVGGAVGWNPIGIIVPCHRVVGAGNKLVGYGGGIENKFELLKLENNQWKNM